MPAFTSNSEQVLRDLKALVLSFGFQTTIEGRTLAEDIVGIAADGIAGRSIDDESGPDGPWPQNAPEYAAWKERRYGVGKPLVRTGQLLSIQSLRGESEIANNSVRQMYGIGQPPTRSATGMGFDPDTDGAITDIEKSIFVSDARPFFLLDDTISDAVFARIEQCCQEYLIGAW